jgi:hypothetical protein
MLQGTSPRLDSSLSMLSARDWRALALAPDGGWRPASAENGPLDR